ncbi:hypothetical protein H072_158 [Dactylellina haptotyla CBS 200.50]|uniref:Uncharacterized protein n=1 Tax=Dactylellina haptotyla (strain CBS 200.50) TaxID=1284197 RepID=S8AY21_DACHA|nr:hypothetical protein H072_158 [Dactylellina haptotyla CBS 200.50]
MQLFKFTALFVATAATVAALPAISSPVGLAPRGEDPIMTGIGRANSAGTIILKGVCKAIKKEHKCELSDETAQKMENYLEKAFPNVAKIESGTKDGKKMPIGPLLEEMGVTLGTAVMDFPHAVVTVAKDLVLDDLKDKGETIGETVGDSSIISSIADVIGRAMAGTV